jgi:proton-dependent oligopeptide transporter, POT family
VSKFGKAFWVIWIIAFWERFGYYGVQTIIVLYFVKQLGYTESQSFYIFGSFTAFVYGFAWIGGWIGDNYLNPKLTLLFGIGILMLAYAALAVATHQTIFFILAGIVVGNALFKANPGALISKICTKNSAVVDHAMIYYYMAINVGSIFSMILVPIMVQKYSWSSAFWLCAFGLFLALCSYFCYRRFLQGIYPEIGKTISVKRILLVIITSAVAVYVIGKLFDNNKLCHFIVYVVVTGAFLYFLKIALALQGVARTRMLVAFVLIIQAILFFVLYNQIPTSLTFFAVHNINNVILGMNIHPAVYQVLNPVFIVIMSPVLVWLYNRCYATHVTKFCIGMTFCAAAFLVLAIPQYISPDGLASPGWIVLTYFLQSTGELLISGLGLAMIAELCPANKTGFVMGVWYLTAMLAGPIGAWLGAMTTIPSTEGVEHISALTYMHLYGEVFFKIGLFTSAVAFLMWIKRPLLNRLLKA